MFRQCFGVHGNSRWLKCPNYRIFFGFGNENQLCSDVMEVIMQSRCKFWGSRACVESVFVAFWGRFSYLHVAWMLPRWDCFNSTMFLLLSWSHHYVCCFCIHDSDMCRYVLNFFDLKTLKLRVFQQTFRPESLASLPKPPKQPFFPSNFSRQLRSPITATEDESVKLLPRLEASQLAELVKKQWAEIAAVQWRFQNCVYRFLLLEVLRSKCVLVISIIY